MGDKKILLVEDDEASRTLIEEILEGLDVAIIETGNVVEALLLYRKHYTSLVLVLMDLKLPKITGYELLKELRAINPSIPAIAVSALGLYELNTKCSEAGFDKWISKPIDIEVFVDIVKEYL